MSGPSFRQAVRRALEAVGERGFVIACERCGEVLSTESPWLAYELTYAHLHHFATRVP